MSKYLVEHCPEHPACSSNGYVYSHRVVMEKKLGRYLTGTEVVHHIDGDTHNNSLSNLMLLKSNTEHRRIHFGWKEINGKWFKRCRICKELLEVNSTNFIIRKNGTPESLCKKCLKPYNAKYRKKNKERFRLYLKEYRKKNKEEVNENQRKYRRNKNEKTRSS